MGRSVRSDETRFGERDVEMKVENSQGLTRRSFITAAAAGSVGVAFAGALSGCSSASSATSALPETWDQEADVVILGFGCTGAAAAMEVVASGDTALILEKMPEATAGGDSTCNGGLMLAGANVPGAMIAGSFGTMSLEYATAIQAEADKIAPWLIDQGASWIAGTDTTAFRFIDGAGVAVYATIKKAVTDLAVPVLYETAATKLIVNPETKEVCGVQAEQSGAQINVKAKKAVIIATGSYTANADMVAEYNMPGVSYQTYGSPANTGDGLAMAKAVGADVWKMPMSLETFYLAYKKASEESGTGIVSAAVPNDSRVIVNMNGARFMNEAMDLIHNKGQLPYLKYVGSLSEGYQGYANLPMFAVMDDACVKSGPLGNTEANLTTWASAMGIYDWSADNGAEIEKGWILKADTLEELAALMTTEDAAGNSLTMDAASLAATVEKYNAYCAAGADPEFGKPASGLKPISTPPFYAVEMSPGLVYTIGGLKANEKGQTIDVFGQPIPRLYSAGNVGQGVELLPYGIPGCMACGKFAAQDAVTLDAWS